MGRSVVLLVTAGWLVCTGVAMGASAADEQWRVAQQYCRNGAWHGAELEYLRHGVLYADDARCAAGVRLRALCLWQADEPAEALRLLGTTVDAGSDAATEKLLATMLMERGYHRLAAFRLRGLETRYGSDDDIRFLHGWNDLQALRLRSAQIHLTSVTGGRYAERARALVPRVGRLGDIRRKNPALAGWLSFFVPGSGQAYCGKWWEAAGSLGINAVFGWWIASLLHAEKYWTAGGVYALGGVRYHLGGALQAARGARRIDREWKMERIMELKDEYGYPVPGDYTIEKVTVGPGGNPVPGFKTGNQVPYGGTGAEHRYQGAND